MYFSTFFSKSTSGVYDFHKSYTVQKCKAEKIKDKTWIPIDTTNVLPAHIHLEQMPGLFKGFVFNSKYSHLNFLLLFHFLKLF